MNKTIIIPLKEMPNSCNKCQLCETTELILDYYNEIHICSANGKIQIKERYEDVNDEVKFNTTLFNFRNQRHPNCPLISINIDELEEAVRIIDGIGNIYVKLQLNTIKLLPTF